MVLYLQTLLFVVVYQPHTMLRCKLCMALTITLFLRSTFVVVALPHTNCAWYLSFPSCGKVGFSISFDDVDIAALIVRILGRALITALFGINVI